MKYPYNAPIIIKAGHWDTFIEKCKKNAPTLEQRKIFMEYAKIMRENADEER